MKNSVKYLLFVMMLLLACSCNHGSKQEMEALRVDISILQRTNDSLLNVVEGKRLIFRFTGSDLLQSDFFPLRNDEDRCLAVLQTEYLGGIE